MGVALEMTQTVDLYERALRILAKHCGIDCGLLGPGGVDRPVETRTLAALLNALGWPAANEQQVAAAIMAIDAADQSPLARVIVTKQTAPMLFDIRLPKGTRTLRWSVALEKGGEHKGEVDFHDLPLRAPSAAGTDCRALALTALPLGYHRLEIEPDGSAADLIVVPDRCWLPPDPDRKYWGLAAQLYLLRSQSDWGIGDFTDLKHLFDFVSSRKGHVVGVNPLHATFPDNPQHSSPYSPASRLLLNVLNIDVESIPEYRDSDAVRALVATDAFQAGSRRAARRAWSIIKASRN